MPRRPPRPCTQPGCGQYAVKGGRCDQHQRTGWEHDSIRGNRHQRGYDKHWERKRKRILQRDNYLCQPCRQSDKLTEAKEVDHIIPRTAGGTEDDDNLQSICTACHRAKTAKERK